MSFNSLISNVLTFSSMLSFHSMICLSCCLLGFREREPRRDDREPRREPGRANDVSSLKSKPVRPLLLIHLLIHFCTLGVIVAALVIIISRNMHSCIITNLRVLFLHAQTFYWAWYGVRCGFIFGPATVCDSSPFIVFRFK